jgi:TatD DNase family protein
MKFPFFEDEKQIVNFHCHLSRILDMKFFLENSDMIYISNALDQDEILKHLPHLSSANLYLTTGQHPLYPSNTITDTRLIELLEQDKLFAVGEIGFDNRNPDFEWQKTIFLSQVDIANQYNKPVIIHCVGHYHNLIPIIKKNFPKTPFIFHGFMESIEIVKQLSQFNPVFSLHKNILKVKNGVKLLRYICENHHYVYETDVCSDGLHDVKKTIEMLK